MLHCGSTNWTADRHYIPQVQNFVLLTREQHNELDEFKRSHPDETKQGFSMFQQTSLLNYWNNKREKPSPVIVMFGKNYLQLSCSEVDTLCDWVIETRERYGNH